VWADVRGRFIRLTVIGKGGIAIIGSEFGIDMPPKIREILADPIKGVSDRDTELKPDEMHQIFYDRYFNIKRPSD
jgi:hypothetical protein